MFDVSYKNASRPLLACSAGGFAAAKKLRKISKAYD